MRSPCHPAVQVPVYIINIRTRQASNPLTTHPGPATVALRPFAVDPGVVSRFEVRIARPQPAQLLLEYELLGDLDSIRLPVPSGPAPQPTDELWRHTCMEVFVRQRPDGPYLEFNFAPGGQWAAYRFSGYRADMAPLGLPSPPRIELRTQPDRLLLSAQLALPAEWAGPLQLAISAVLEDTRGAVSYWALRHPGARPDFHHVDSFAFEI